MGFRRSQVWCNRLECLGPLSASISRNLSSGTRVYKVRVGGAWCELTSWPVFGGYNALGGSSLPSGFSLHEVSLQVFPKLMVNETTTNLMLLWPTRSLGFAVQQSHEIGAANWVTLTNAPMPNISNNQIGIPKPTGTTFLRLVSQ